MRIKPDALDGHLRGGLPPVLLISGDEPFLAMEACDAVRKAARQAGYTERVSYQTGKGFDWSLLAETLNAPSLFSEQRLVELHWEQIPEDAGKQILQSWFENPTEDCRLLLVSPRITTASLNTKWMKALENHCLHVQIWPLTLQEFPAWVGSRLRQAGFQPTAGAVQALCENVEGNLLAAAQEIEKLRLLQTDRNLDETQILQAVADSSRYTVYELMETVLQGDLKHALHILHNLQDEGVAPSIVLWTLARDIRLLGRLRRAAGNPQEQQKLFARHNVPKKQWKAYELRSRQLRPALLQEAHGYCTRADQAVKGVIRDNPWRLLCSACLALGGKPGPSESALL